MSGMGFEFELCTNLVANTAHITMRDAELLKASGEADPTGIVAYEFDYGFLIFTGEDKDEHEENMLTAKAHGYSEDLLNLIRFARGKGCRYLLLDCDGPIYESLPRSS